MGEVSQDTLNGLICQECGHWMPECDDPDTGIFINPPGHPRTCPDCEVLNE
jgi:hypothetical protein